MNYKDLAIEFTETNYISREQIIGYFGYSFNESLWWEVCRYRKNFSIVMPLQCQENSNVFVVLYAKLMQKLDDISRDAIVIMKLFNEVHFNKNFFYNYKNYFVKVIFEEILPLLKIYEINISINTLILLVNGTKKPSTKNERFAKNLFMIFYRLVFSKNEKVIISKEFLEKIGRQLGIKDLFRSERWFLDIDNTLEAGFDPALIPIKFKQLLTFIHSKIKIHPLIKATAVFYYFKSGIIVNNNIDLIAMYLFFYTLKISNSSHLVLTMPFIKYIIKKAKKFDDAYYDCLKSNNDITYLVNIFVEIIELGIKEIKKTFSEKPSLIKLFNENLTTKNSIKEIETLKVGKYDKSIMKIRSLGLHNKEQLFLQTIKNSKKEKYTLDDFKNITNASYEKARYSMNSFVEKGIFNKTRIGKKFIYTLVNKDF